MQSNQNQNGLTLIWGFNIAGIQLCASQITVLVVTFRFGIPY